MISTTTMTRAARVALQGYLTAYFFKEIVIDRTIQVVSKSEKVSISLVTSTVCSSTAVLLLATAKAARQFLSDDFQRVPAPKDVDDTAGPNAPFAHENVADVISTTKAFGAPARPSSSRAVIESTEPTFDDPTKGLSTIDSDTTLIAYDEDLAKDVLSGDRAPDTTDLESFTDESTFYEEDCEAIPHSLTDDEPEHTSHAECDSHTIDNLIRIMSALSLDNVPSHISTISLANVPSHSSTYPLDDVPSHLSIYSRPRTLSGSINNSFSLDNVPLHLSTLRPHHTLHDHAIDTLPGPSQPSELRPTHSLHDHTIANLPGTLPLHNGSPQSSKCQLQRILVHDYPIDDLIRRMADLSLDEVPSQSSTLRPHHALHDHAFDTPPSNTKALALADNLAIDMLPNNADTLTLDDNHAINSLPKNAETLTLDDNHAIAIDALLQKPEAHTLDDNASQSSELQLQHTLYDNTNETLLHKMDTFSLDDGQSQSSELQLQSTLHDDTIDMLLQQMDTLSLDDDPSRSQAQHILHDDTIDDRPHHSLSPRHLHRNTDDTTTPPTPYSELSNLLLAIVTLSPQNFNYNTPYTTMLSTPYFEMWNLLFSTVVPRNYQNFSNNTP